MLNRDVVKQSWTLPLSVLKKYRQPCFVETGTFRGGAIHTALEAGCDRIYSTEISDFYHAEVAAKYKDNKNVHLFHGDSLDMLPRMLLEVDEPAVFWLDAHYETTPVLEELACISKHKYAARHTIMIDDVRIFRAVAYWAAKTSLTAVLQHVASLFPTHYTRVEDSNIEPRDILVVTPLVP